MRPALPAVKNAAWVRNPIDRFVLAALERQGLQPAPEADRRTLARRVSLDLTGLPPTPEMVEAFVNDRSPNAYEKLVDQLLASPHWGEHRARYWLDAARYGDTNGIHIDAYREIWSYRDWVIDAFNRNMPFDQFTVEQLAGDLLPQCDRRRADRYGIQSLQHHYRRRRRDRRRIPRVLRPRPHRNDVAGLDGPDGGLRGLPRPQVRSAAAKRVLCLDGVFQQHAAAGPGRQREGHAAGDLRAGHARGPQALADAGSRIADVNKQIDARKQAARAEFDKWLAGPAKNAISAKCPRTACVC